jgi:hypothetical protein
VLSVTANSRLETNMVGMWTTFVILTRRRDGRFTFEERHAEVEQ